MHHILHLDTGGKLGQFKTYSWVTNDYLSGCSLLNWKWFPSWVNLNQLKYLKIAKSHYTERNYIEAAGWDLCGQLIPSDPIGKWVMRAQLFPANYKSRKL